MNFTVLVCGQIPDQLGYGGTDKPIEPKSYVASSICKSLIGILDAEGIGKVVAVGMRLPLR